jgi:hypothetical protein
LPPVRSVENILFLNDLPGQLAPPLVQLITKACELLLLL